MPPRMKDMRLTCGRGFFTASCHFVVVTDNDNTNDDDEVGVK